MLADGDHGKYQAIFLDLGDLSDNGASAFTSDEWTTLSSYEARFGVRRVALYTYPTTAYGLVAGARRHQPGDESDPGPLHRRGRGGVRGDELRQPGHHRHGLGVSRARGRRADGAAARPTTRATSTRRPPRYPDGREALALTFAQAPYAFHTLQLGYGLVSWATRGLFVGERHAYLCAQIDDLFLASVIYPATGADLPDDRRRHAGARRLAERAPREPAGRGPAPGVGGEPARVAGRRQRRADRQGRRSSGRRSRGSATPGTTPI